MKKKKVLIIAANGLGNSGVPNVFMQIVRSLSNKCEFDLIITREDYYFKEEFLSFGGRIFLFGKKPNKNKIQRIFWRLFGLKNYIKKELTKILKNNKYDIIHSFKESESWMYLKVAKKFNIKKRIIHNNRQRDNLKSFLAKLFTNLSISKSLKYSTDNVSVSKTSGYSFFKKKQFKVIYNSYDQNKYYFRNSKNQNNYPLLLQVGTFLPLKNQLFSLDVLEKVKKSFTNIKMIFIGKPYDLDYFASFERKIKKFNLSKNVEIYDNFGELNDLLLENITYTLVPSQKEGLSLVAIESQASGIKVFASTGIPREVNLGNIDFLDLSSDLWAQKIIKDFYLNKNKRKKVSTELFSIKIFKSNILDLYGLR